MKQQPLELLPVQIINKSKHANPEYATELSAGMDLSANLECPIVLKPLERALVPTGIHIALRLYQHRGR
jgi:dUTP pyrophosphatase